MYCIIGQQISRDLLYCVILLPFSQLLVDPAELRYDGRPPHEPVPQVLPLLHRRLQHQLLHQGVACSSKFTRNVWRKKKATVKNVKIPCPDPEAPNLWDTTH